MLQAPPELPCRIGEVPVKDASQFAIPLVPIPLEQPGNPLEPRVIGCCLVALKQPQQPHLAVATGPAGGGQRTESTTGLSRDAVGEDIPKGAQQTPQSPEGHSKVVEGVAVVGIRQAVAGDEEIVQAHQGAPAGNFRRRSVQQPCRQITHRGRAHVPLPVATFGPSPLHLHLT